MLDREYVESMERRMAESDGMMTRDDQQWIWEGLQYFDEALDTLKFALSLLTDRPIGDIVKMASDVAAKRHPGLAPQEAIECELRRIDAGEPY